METFLGAGISSFSLVCRKLCCFLTLLLILTFVPFSFWLILIVLKFPGHAGSYRCIVFVCMHALALCPGFIEKWYDQILIQSVLSGKVFGLIQLLVSRSCLEFPHLVTDSGNEIGNNYGILWRRYWYKWAPFCLQPSEMNIKAKKYAYLCVHISIFFYIHASCWVFWSLFNIS